MDKRIILLDSISIKRADGPATYSKGDIIYLDLDEANSLISQGAALHYIKWTDLRVPTSATQRGGSKTPTFAQMLDNGAASQGVFIEYFAAGSEQELYFTAQFGHDYALGTDIHAHVHWTPDGNGNAGEVVNWALEYAWANIGSTFPNTTIISGNSHFPADAALVDKRHYLTELGIIDGSSIEGVSSMLVCRVYRDAAGALDTDDYGNAAGLLEIDFHYKTDDEGSVTEYVKNS